MKKGQEAWAHTEEGRGIGGWGGRWQREWRRRRGHSRRGGLVAADVRRQVSWSLVEVLALHADQDKEISRGVNTDTTACSRKVGGKKGPFRRKSSSHFRSSTRTLCCGFDINSWSGLERREWRGAFKSPLMVKWVEEGGHTSKSHRLEHTVYLSWSLKLPTKLSCPS